MEACAPMKRVCTYAIGVCLYGRDVSVPMEGRDVYLRVYL